MMDLIQCKRLPKQYRMRKIMATHTFCDRRQQWGVQTGVCGYEPTEVCVAVKRTESRKVVAHERSLQQACADLSRISAQMRIHDRSNYNSNKKHTNALMRMS